MPKLRVRAYKSTFVPVSNRQLQEIGEGICESGDDFEFTDDLDEPADVALVVSGLKYPGSRLFEARDIIRRRFNGRTLVSESPFFRQGAQPHDGPNPYFRLSVGGFMRDDAKFHPEGFKADGSRWRMISEEQGLELLPWDHSPSGSILICMQKPSDASLRGLDMREWTRAMISKVRCATTREIVVRPHPLDPRRGVLDLYNPKDIRWSKEDLRNDLEQAYAVVTYTSLSAIESVMAGVPTFCMSEANHAWDVSLKDHWPELEFDDLNHWRPDRQPWLDALSWGQWKLSELREGTPWRRLRPLLT